MHLYVSCSYASDQGLRGELYLGGQYLEHGEGYPVQFITSSCLSSCLFDSNIGTTSDNIKTELLF